MKALHYALVLTLVCLAAALGVAGTYSITRQRIADKEEIARQKAQAAALPKGAPKVKFEPVMKDAKPEDLVLRAVDEAGLPFAYVAQGEAQGYAGKIVVMIGMDATAEKVLGITVVSQNETPGLGTRIAEIPSEKTWVSVITGTTQSGEFEPVPMFLKQFRGKTHAEMQLKTATQPGIDGISGATISSRATVNATRNAIEKIQKAVKGELPAETKPEAVPKTNGQSAATAKH